MEILLTAASLAAAPPEAPLVAAAAAPELDTPPTPETSPEPSPEPTSLRDFDWHYLVDHDLWLEVPADVPELLDLLPTSDLYVQSLP